ncbi:MAG: tRNA lysidine(34) synthetase TilS, partial [Campylobacteraceae bacterium]|nr:tRNA lysidine(34) synthetase TilS [Campylobacteraceae bacterium]
KSLKKRGYILSSAQRDEILKQREIIINHFAISITESYIWISPKSCQVMDKNFKDLCRIYKIPNKHRAYILEKDIVLKEIVSVVFTD